MKKIAPPACGRQLSSLQLKDLVPYLLQFQSHVIFASANFVICTRKDEATDECAKKDQSENGVRLESEDESGEKPEPPHRQV